MMVETVGEARALGWRITARCVYGKRDEGKSIRECKYLYDLDLESIIWTRGALFPVSMLAGRMKCPRCGSRRVALLFNLPGRPMEKRA